MPRIVTSQVIQGVSAGFISICSFCSAKSSPGILRYTHWMTVKARHFLTSKLSCHTLKPAWKGDKTLGAQAHASDFFMEKKIKIKKTTAFCICEPGNCENDTEFQVNLLHLLDWGWWESHRNPGKYFTFVRLGLVRVTQNSRWIFYICESHTEFQVNLLQLPESHRILGNLLHLSDWDLSESHRIPGEYFTFVRLGFVGITQNSR